MQDLEGKKTTLNDDAEIYKSGAERSDNKSARQHWKELSAKGKWQYFMTYYFWKLALGLAVLILVGYMIYSALKPEPKELSYVVILDNSLSADRLDEYFKDIAVKVDPTKSSAVTVDTRLTSSLRTTSDIAAISTYIYAGSLDILIAVEPALFNYAQNGIICDLEKTLPADILAAVPEEKRFYFHYTPDGESPLGSDEKDILVGIRLDGMDLIEKTKFSTGETGYILTLVTTGGHVKDGTTFKVLRAILSLPQISE